MAQAAIQAAFEITSDPRDTVRRTAVVSEVIARCQAFAGRNLFDPEIHHLVDRAAVALGARAVQPQNKKLFRGMRPRQP
jgi:putative N-acetylmannosamine-6-phosphate epimerase